MAGASKLPSDWARTAVPPTSTSAATGTPDSSSMTKPVTTPSFTAAPLMIRVARSSDDVEHAIAIKNSKRGDRREFMLLEFFSVTAAAHGTTLIAGDIPEILHRPAGADARGGTGATDLATRAS